MATPNDQTLPSSIPHLATDSTRDLIANGYLRETRRTFKKDTPFNIPPEINNLISLFFKEGIYSMKFDSRPMGFTVIMDSRGRNAIVVNTGGYKELVPASRLYGINDIYVNGMKHKDILKTVVSTPMPMNIYFRKVCIYYSCLLFTYSHFKSIL